ncbi:hypothetical protein R69608_00320 [Paraburkholderia nemoris]|jgi:hypothetical protein|uniref:Uncharacterized protein n=1 Tax=Paraburkholderia nemoris TaxID=2793076 RepID=A0ABM8RW48_9BURK|nr:hypothetical protein LMG22931_01757 [Paraburkholderia nemoris]CAE6774977.1 hypothetical protein R69776_04029 [Paraburkholderia nemoris]CAE6842613.1 hypothetical protein R69619_07082 [Paraburkholderia nemoris]CAE6863438.1 hypothetical protein R69608_00320 [Paraburkholderia nemoris]
MMGIGREISSAAKIWSAHSSRPSASRHKCDCSTTNTALRARMIRYNSRTVHCSNSSVFQLITISPAIRQKLAVVGRCHARKVRRPTCQARCASAPSRAQRELECRSNGVIKVASATRTIGLTPRGKQCISATLRDPANRQPGRKRFICTIKAPLRATTPASRRRPERPLAAGGWRPGTNRRNNARYVSRSYRGRALSCCCRRGPFAAGLSGSDPKGAV